METIAELIGSKIEIYALIAIITNLISIAGCAFIAYSLFHLAPRKSKLSFIICAVICTAFGIFDSLLFANGSDSVQFLWSTAELVMPFCCMMLVFRLNGIWKAFLVTLGYTLLEAVQFIIILLFFGFDNDNRNEPLELITAFLVNVVFFFIAYILLTRYIKKRFTPVNLSKNAAILFILVVAAVAVFVTSLLLLGSEYSQNRRTEFGFMLMNIPLLTAAIAFAFITFNRMKAKSNAYLEQLDMQIKQFEMMEKMYDEIRIFRHDFPKKMRPLIAYLDEDKPEEAREMAVGFTDFVEGTRQRFNTGNFRLDTVLYCEQQIAVKDNIKIIVPFDSVFPKDGIDADDIYTIFPNALDNAIEACRKIEGEKDIVLRSVIKGKIVAVSIINPVAGDVKVRNGLPQTIKSDKESHGFGFRSIKKAASKYGRDNVSFSVHDGKFELRIIFEINK